MSACALCNGAGFVVSPTNGIAERCPCMKGKIVHVIALGRGALAGFFCLVCDPGQRRELPIGGYMLIERRAWLPDGRASHWDPKQRARGEAPQHKAVCIDCVQGFGAVLQTQGRGLAVRAAAHMNEPGGFVLVTE
jgi:hypothetical protein